MTHLHSPKHLRKGSVIAITVMFMSFLLIGIVGAAYLLSSHLRITSLSGDYIQASYNAESALEMALYRRKHRFEGYEGGRKDAWAPASSLANTMESMVQYRMKPGEKVSFVLNGASRRFALFYEETENTTIHDLRTMRSAIPSISGSSSSGATGNCLEVNLVGVNEETGPNKGKDESISVELPCSTSMVSLASLTDPYPFTPSRQNRPYPFGEFLGNHSRVYMLLKDITANQSGQASIELPRSADSQTIAHPQAQITAEGIFGSTIIRKIITLPQNQIANITGNVLVTPQ